MSEDPVLIARARFARLAGLAKRVAYGLFAIATATFMAGWFAGFGRWASPTLTALFAGSALLLPATIVAWAVRAADRADRGLDSGH